MNDTREDQVYRLIYKFSNPSLGPVDGELEVCITVDHGKITKATDPRSGKALEVDQIKGIKDFMKALHHQTEGLEVQYDRNGIPLHIVHPGEFDAEGGRYTIKISYQKNVKE